MSSKMKIDVALEDSKKAYFAQNVSVLHPMQQKLIEVTRNVPRSRMMSSLDQMVLFSNMINFAGGKKCIDVGVYTGMSALTMALSVPADGTVVACDVSEEFTSVGIPIWEEAGVKDKINLVIAPASQTLQSLIDKGEGGTFDFIYIDADKPSYDDYYEKALILLRQNGIVALDNVWYSGRLVNDDQTAAKDVRSLRALNIKVQKDERVQAVMMNCGDGVYICRKK